MSAISGLTLSVSGTSTLTGGANITGTCNTNQLNIINNSSFSQSGSGTFSTGTGAVNLNGTVICSSNSSFTGLATFNGSILLPSGKTLTLPTGRVISNSNDVVDTTSGQTVAGVKTFSSQIVANGGINAGSNSITCGSLTCSSETDSGVLTVNGMLNANGGITVPANQNLSISRKVSGFQQKVWNCNDLGLSSNPTSRYLLIAQNGALSSYGNNFGVLTLKGQIGIENGAVTNIIFFDIQIGTRGSVSTNGYVNSYYSLSNITSYLDFIVTSTASGNNFYLYLKSSAYFMFEFVAGGNEYSSTPLLNEPTSTGATFASGETVVVSSVINNVATSNSSNFYYGSSSITCGSLTCSSENDTGALTVTGALNANSGLNLGLSSQNNTTSTSLTIAGTDDTTFNFFNYASGSNAYAKNVVINASNLVNTAGWNNNGDMGYAGSLYLNGGGYTETANNGTQSQNLNGGHVYIQGGFGYAIYGGSSTLPSGGLNCVPGNIYFNSGKLRSGSTHYNTYTNYMMINGSNGRVGINTTSPGYTLDVNGSINAGGGITCSSYSGPNGSNIYLIPATLPTASSNTGLGIAWNATGGITDTAFLTYGQGGTTQGFTFYSVNGGANSRSLLATIATYGTSFTNTITANGGLTIPAGQTLTVNGTLVVSGTYSPTSVSTSGVISANGGITMGSNQNITLASTFTTPTFGQLGYTASVSVAGPIVYNVSTNYNMCNLTVGVGVWIFNYGFTLSSSGTNTIQSYVSQLSNNSTFTGNYANTLNQFRGSIQTTDNTQRVSNTYSTVLTLTSSTTIYLTFQHVSQNSTSGINMFINATRIA